MGENGIMIKISTCSTGKKSHIVYQEHEKNDRNFDTIELEFCSFPKDVFYVPQRTGRKTTILYTSNKYSQY